MAWRQSDDKSLSEPVMVSLLTHMCHSASMNWPSSADLLYIRGQLHIRGQVFIIVIIDVTSSFNAMLSVTTPIKTVQYIFLLNSSSITYITHSYASGNKNKEIEHDLKKKMDGVQMLKILEYNVEAKFSVVFYSSNSTRSSSLHYKKWPLWHIP